MERITLCDLYTVMKALEEHQVVSEARRLLTDIESGNLEQKLAKRARRKRTLITLLAGFGLLAYGIYDLSARIAGDDASTAARAEFLKGNRGAAVQVCRDAAARWPVTWTARLLHRQADAYEGAMDLGHELQALLNAKDVESAAAALRENRGALLRGTQKHQSELAVAIEPRMLHPAAAAG